MGVKIEVPSLGESVSEATVAKWFKQEGDAVEQDEPLVELETDKVTLEVNAPASGTLESIAIGEEETVEVGAILGSIAEGAAPAKPASAAKETATPATASPAASADRPLAPSVRKLVAENDLDPSKISGTGKDGRITKGDALQALETGSAKSGTSATVAGSASDPGISKERREERVRMSALRRKIAERLKDSQNTAAILTTFNEIDMTNIMALRKDYKDAFEKKYGIKLGFMSLFAKAAVHALKEVPAVNAQIDGNEIIYKNYYDISIAVGTPQGLVVPVVRNADTLSLAQIEETIGELAKKARDGKLTMEELTGGTFTISNGGVYGSLLSTPIINPPQSGILGMHKTEQRPVVINGEIVIRPMMYVALSYDHRIIDGKESVTFLVKLKEAIEDPRRLLLGL